jgi:hypothetical protein
MLGPHRQAGEAEPAQNLADRALVQLDAEAPRDHRLQVDPPPAHHAVRSRIRSVLDDGLQLLHLLGREPWRRPRVGSVVQPGETLGVVAVDPVPQGLPVHPGVPRRVLTGMPLEHQRQGEHPPRRLGIAAARRRPPQVARVQLQACHRHRHRPLLDPKSGSQPSPRGGGNASQAAPVGNRGRWYNQLPLLEAEREGQQVVGQLGAYCGPGATRPGRFFNWTQLIAFSDPNDIMSYPVPDRFAERYIESRLCPSVTNVTINVAAVNALLGLGEVANPLSAHTGYDADERVGALLARGAGHPGVAPIVAQRCTWREIDEGLMR